MTSKKYLKAWSFFSKSLFYLLRGFFGGLLLLIFPETLLLQMNDPNPSSAQGAGRLSALTLQATELSHRSTAAPKGASQHRMDLQTLTSLSEKWVWQELTIS